MTINTIILHEHVEISQILHQNYYDVLGKQLQFNFNLNEVEDSNMSMDMKMKKSSSFWSWQFKQMKLNFNQSYAYDISIGVTGLPVTMCAGWGFCKLSMVSVHDCSQLRSRASHFKRLGIRNKFDSSAGMVKFDIPIVESKPDATTFDWSWCLHLLKVSTAAN
jgi:hypothetical protein